MIIEQTLTKLYVDRRNWYEWCTPSLNVVNIQPLSECLKTHLHTNKNHFALIYVFLVIKNNYWMMDSSLNFPREFNSSYEMNIIFYIVLSQISLGEKS